MKRAFALAFALVCIPMPAQAAVAWRWPSPPCADESTWQKQSDAINADAQVEIARPPSDGPWRARIRITAASSVREVEGETCEAVAEAALLYLRVMQADKPPTQALPPGLPSRAAARPTLSVGAALSVDTSTLEAPAPGVDLDIAWRPAWLHASIGASAYAPQDIALPGQPGVGADFAMSRARARICAAWEIAAWSSEWGPCVGGHARWIRAEGYGARAASSADGWRFEGALGLRYAWLPSAHWSVFATAFAVTGFAREQYVVVASGIVHQTPAVSMLGAMGGAVHF